MEDEESAPEVTDPGVRTFEVKVRKDTVVLRELSVIEFYGCLKQTGGELTADTANYGIRRSIVSINGADIRYEDLSGVRLAQKFPRLRDTLLLHAAWQQMHVPAPEDQLLAKVNLDNFELDEDNNAIFLTELVAGRLVKFREMTTEEYFNTARVYEDDGWTLTNVGIVLTLVSDGRDLVPRPDDIDKHLEFLNDRFRVCELLSLRAAWESVHMPSTEEIRRVREIRA